MTPDKFLGEYYESGRIRIAETGNVSTRSIARWVAGTPEATFTSVDLDSRRQIATHHELECDGTAAYCTFKTQDHSKFLAEQSWLDVVFLLPADLQKGLEEFSLAISTGAGLVVLYDFQTRAALAIRKAKDLGWTVTHHGMYSVLRRP